jgi:hypothetical protein
MDVVSYPDNASVVEWGPHIFRNNFLTSKFVKRFSFTLKYVNVNYPVYHCSTKFKFVTVKCKLFTVQLPVHGKFSISGPAVT